MVSVARPEGEEKSNRSDMELDYCKNSDDIKTLKELSHNDTILNRRLDVLESKFEKYLCK